MLTDVYVAYTLADEEFCGNEQSSSEFLALTTLGDFFTQLHESQINKQ